MMNGNMNKSWMHGYVPAQQQTTVMYSMHHRNYCNPHHKYTDPMLTPTGFSTKPHQQNYHTKMYFGADCQHTTPRNMNNRSMYPKYCKPQNTFTAPSASTTTNTNGLINGFKNFVNGFINPKLNCDFYSDHNRHYNPKYRNNFMRCTDNNSDRAHEQPKPIKPPEEHLQTVIFNISVQPPILCQSQYTTRTIPKSTENPNNCSSNLHNTKRIVPDPDEIIAIFTSEDFPELPVPRHRPFVWEDKPKTTCSIFNLTNTSCNSTKKNKKMNNNNNSNGSNDNNSTHTLPIAITMEARIADENLKAFQRDHKESECDSEDSFIIFTNPSPPKYSNMNCGRSGINNNIISCESTAGATPFRPKIRDRQISECSDDSFVICFTDDAAEGLIEYSDTTISSEYDSDSSSNSDDENNSVVGKSPLKTENNNSYNIYGSDGPPSQPDSGFDDGKEKKVRFNLKPEVHIMNTWNFAYRAARKGHWENYARDRSRFKYRVERLSSILNPILDSNHRKNIFGLRFCDKTINLK